MNPLRVALPLGIGDCHWACTKLRGLSQHHGGRPVHAYVNSSANHKSIEFLRLVPQIDRAFQHHTAPFDITRELEGGYRSSRWASLKGSARWRGYDYVVVPNGHLEAGKPLATYFYELETDYSYPLNIPQADRDHARSLAPPGSVLLYPSGIGPNDGFHKNTWTWGMWGKLVQRLNEAGIEPVIVGANTKDDLGYMQRLRKVLARRDYVDLVGKTTVAQVAAIISKASVWCGLNSGLGIIAAMLGVPTVMFWADKRYPIPGAHGFDYRMQTSWLPPSTNGRYRTFSYGSLELKPDRVADEILDLASVEVAA